MLRVRRLAVSGSKPWRTLFKVSPELKASSRYLFHHACCDRPHFTAALLYPSVVRIVVATSGTPSPSPLFLPGHLVEPLTPRAVCPAILLVRQRQFLK